ncbi:peroxisomal biogenesis factor 11 [Exophiala viscosa]|uniref:Peroxisomal biogenesis factor 11 n=1 Tax=Exophiala viscosa TaxID=2486360 RepID=A0AAN6IHA5_9EURO|nr:peroxisomal biogenesis factor 11 [Exophiala viscosa]KAI1629404.1 peroxisomal biogenesis factor 11 [Exophiala viscosa]
MLHSLSRYANEAAGIEKTLKFIQSFSQVAENAVASTPKEALQWKTAKEQTNLARRYFRLFKWIDSWTAAYNQYQTYLVLGSVSKPPSDVDNIKVVLTVAKFSLLGMYLFLEMFTLTDAMQITKTSWAPTIQIEALKFWFYSLAVSVVLSVYELFVLQFSSTSPAHANGTNSSPVENEKTKASQATITVKSGGKESTTVVVQPKSTSIAHDLRANRRQALFKQIVADSCDLLIPGAVVGWVPLGPVPVGVAGSISAVLGGSDVWARVNP